MESAISVKAITNKSMIAITNYWCRIIYWPAVFQLRSYLLGELSKSYTLLRYNLSVIAISETIYQCFKALSESEEDKHVFWSQ